MYEESDVIKRVSGNFHSAQIKEGAYQVGYQIGSMVKNLLRTGLTPPYPPAFDVWRDLHKQ